MAREWTPGEPLHLELIIAKQDFTLDNRKGSVSELRPSFKFQESLLSTRGNLFHSQ